jgi:hypothetical protein
MQTHGLGSAIDKTKATPKKNPLKAGFFMFGDSVI